MIIFLSIEDPVENPETLKQKFHQMSLKTSDKFETLTKDVEKSQTKQEKLLSQTQGRSTDNLISSSQDSYIMDLLMNILFLNVNTCIIL